MKLRVPVRSSRLLPLVAALFGCAASGQGEEAQEEKEVNVIELAFIPKTSNNLVFEMGNDGAQFGARDLKRSLGLEIEVEFMASPTLDPAAEAELIREAIAAKKDGLLVSCVDASVTEAIDEAVEAGIPVITYDSDCPDSKRLGFYSMQSEQTGAKGADLLAAALGEGEKTVAILTGREGADNLERRVNGFMQRLEAAYPDISVVATVNCEETAASCGTAIEEEIIEQHPDLDGLFVVGLWGLLDACTCSATGMACQCDDTQMPKWKAAAKNGLETVAYDTLPIELELMKQGYIGALIGQKYFGWGYETVELMVEHLTEGAAIDDFIDSGFDVVCPNNVADMSAKWAAADFRSELAPSCDL